MIHLKIRKLLVSVLAVTVAFGLIAGCSTKPAPKDNGTTKPADTTAAASKEAPALAALVKDGKLPKVEDRLPKDPMVLKAEKIGQYGGTWHTVTKGKSDGALFERFIGYEPWVRWDQTWTGKVEPNVMTKFEASADAKTFTFTIREGLKWSDGKPVTTKDVETYLKLISNKELSPGGPGFYNYLGKVGKLTLVDDRNFKIVFEDPNGLFLQSRAYPDTDWLQGILPTHYVGKYVLPEGKDFVDAEIKRLGLKDYPALIKQILDWRDNPDLPTLYQFVVKTPLSSGKTALFDRNPYYWKVDTAGNQLPYIDHFSAEIHEDVNTMTLKALNGELDWQDRHINTNTNKPVFVDGQQKGNYKLFETTPTAMNQFTFQLNLTHKDPVLRKVFQDKKFRMALSHAINRKAAIDTIFVGQGEPAQAAPLKGTPWYDEQFTKQFTEYDAAKANALLDEMGLKKDAKGMRLRPDGKALTFTLEVANNQVPTGSDYGEMLRKNFAAIGVDMQVKVQERSLFYDRKKANEHDAMLWGGDGGVEVLFEQRYYIPTSEESAWGVPWYQWWSSKGKQGEEPNLPEIKKQFELFDQVRQTSDAQKQQDLMKQVLKIAKDNFWVIGLCTVNKQYGIVRNDFHNTPKDMWSAWLWPHPAPMNTATWYTTRK